LNHSKEVDGALWPIIQFKASCIFYYLVHPKARQFSKPWTISFRA
jgi:hypothetical protein